MTKLITVTIRIQPSAAIRDGRSACGEHTLTLTDADIAALTPDQREALALHVAGEHPWSRDLTHDAPAQSEATLATLATLLDCRRAYVAAEAESAVKAKADREAREQADREALLPVIDVAVRCPVAELVARNAYYSAASTNGYLLVPIRGFAEAHGIAVERLPYTGHAAGIAARESEAQTHITGLVEAAKAAELAKSEAEKSALADILKRSNPTLYACWLAGRARGIDIEAELAGVLAAGIGLATTDERSASKPAGALSPETFAAVTRVEALCAALPWECDVDAYPTWRAAEDDEQGDDDGEVKDYDHLVICVQATIAGHDVVVSIDPSELSSAAAVAALTRDAQSQGLYD